MKIAGFQKNSFVDYPGKIAAVVFTGGCNFNCWYCHNRDILSDFNVMDTEEVFSFLKKRVGLLDAVVFTGGEVTLQKDLPGVMLRAKEMGFLVKLDTNGTLPNVIKDLIDKKIPDYIAMDLKAPYNNYKLASCVDTDISALKDSVKIIMESGVPYEFRTTCIPQLTVNDIEQICKEISGAENYALQQYQHRDTYTKVLGIKVPPHEPSFFSEAKAVAEKYVKNVFVRGV